MLAPASEEAPDAEIARVLAAPMERLIELAASAQREAPAIHTSSPGALKVALVGFGRPGLRTVSQILKAGGSAMWIPVGDPGLREVGVEAPLASRTWLAYPDHGPRYDVPPRLAIAAADVILVGTRAARGARAGGLAEFGKACTLVVESARRGQTIIATSSCYVGCIKDLLVDPLRERGLVDGRDVHVDICTDWQGLEQVAEPDALTRILRESREAREAFEAGGAQALNADLKSLRSSREHAVRTVEISLFGDVRERRVERIAKRAIDIFVSATALMLLGPVLLVIAAAIYLDDGRPILFSQTRAGRHGRLFRFRKFRTMVDGAEGRLGEVLQLNEIRGPGFQLDHDPRVTRLGAFLRKSSLDELPQLWNVLVGEMSLVGPRPAPLCEVTDYEPWHLRRLSVQPGITGLAQIKCRRYREFDEKALYDAEYIDNWSLALDVRVILATIPAVLRMSGR